MTVSQSLIDRFMSHRRITEKLIQLVSPDHYNFKPTPSCLTFKELIVHILYSTYQFARAIELKNTKPLAFQEEEELHFSNNDLKTLCSDYTEKTKEILSSISHNHLTDIIDTTKEYGRKLTLAELFQLSMDHEAHHKGELFIYLRSMGIEKCPPFIS